jgi:hypothetical protein
MKKIISKPHLNISAWIKIIFREKSVTKAKIQSFRTGATACQRRCRVKEKEKRIHTLLIALMLGNMSLDEYLINTKLALIRFMYVYELS